MNRTLILPFIVFAVAQTFAQSNSQPHAWPQEPTSFFSIRFGQPLRASVAECPKDTSYGTTRYDTVATVRLGYPCFEVIGAFYEVDNIRPFFHVYVTEIDGAVESISAKFNNGNSANLSGIDADGIASSLVEKFGPPHKKQAEALHNNAGATYEDKILIWSGMNVAIEFHSVGGEYNHGLISVYTAKYFAEDQRKRNQQKSTVQSVF